MCELRLNMNLPRSNERPRTWVKYHSSCIFPQEVHDTLTGTKMFVTITLQDGSVIGTLCGTVYSWMCYHEVWDWSESTLVTNFSHS